MTDTSSVNIAGVQPKTKYHHGDLREALIMAAYAAVNEDGADIFSLSDACKRAGVSTAAPYRHFKSREEILAEVTSRGFRTMTEDARQAVEANGEGTLEAIIAMGQAYVAFAVKNQGVFALMFGRGPAMADAENVAKTGTECFGYLIAQIKQYCARHGFKRNADEIAVDLWTFVHGASALLTDGKYERVTPGLDVDQLIARATPLLVER